MESLKDIYLKSGHKEERMEGQPWFLRELAIYSAIEIVNHLHEGEQDFTNTRELASILDRYKPEEDKPLLEARFPHMGFWRAASKDSDKVIQRPTELGLEMKLAASELEQVPDLPYERLDVLRDFLVDFSKEMSGYETDFRRGLAEAA